MIQSELQQVHFSEPFPAKDFKLLEVDHAFLKLIESGTESVCSYGERETDSRKRSNKAREL